MKPSSIRSRGYQYKDPAIYRKLMVDTLEYWRDCRPAFYSLLSILPPTSFRIIADDDYRDVRDEWTIPDFMENRKLFHPRLTCFTICFRLTSIGPSGTIATRTGTNARSIFAASRGR